MTGAAAPRNRHALPAHRSAVPQASTIDLHTHTQRSDGVLPPAELVAAAAAVGVRLLAITDHDTLAGVREVQRDRVVPDGLEVVPGIEINSVLEREDQVRAGDGEVHILGLGVDADDDALEAALARQRDARRIRFEQMVHRLREIGMPVDRALEDQPTTTDEDALGRPRIARALIQCGYATSIEDAFQRHLSKGRPAYVPRHGLGPIEAIRAIRAAGGIASLAHFSEAPGHLGFLRELKESGLDGLEVYYRSFEPSTVGLVKDVATRLGLVMTGGTDFHGDRETYAEAHAALAFPDDAATAFRSALRATP